MSILIILYNVEFCFFRSALKTKIIHFLNRHFDNGLVLAKRYFSDWTQLHNTLIHYYKSLFSPLSSLILDIS